jgi:hypothetical protein
VEDVDGQVDRDHMYGVLYEFVDFIPGLAKVVLYTYIHHICIACLLGRLAMPKPPR